MKLSTTTCIVSTLLLSLSAIPAYADQQDRGGDRVRQADRAYQADRDAAQDRDMGRDMDRMHDRDQDQDRDMDRDMDRMHDGDQDRDMDRDMDGQQDGLGGVIYGSALMTEQERAQYREEMKAAKTEQEREEIRLQHHSKMQARHSEL